MPKKVSLVPIEYDEISLVDSGGGAAEDGSIAPSVLIMKRNNNRKEGNLMSGVEVVEKRKGQRVCRDCETTIAKTTDKECPSCGSSNIKKSLVIVTKAVGDDEDDLENLEVEEVDDELEETDDVDDDDEGDDEDGEEEEDDDDEDDDEDEDEDDDDTPPEGVKKSDPNLVGVEALAIATAMAEDIQKVFTNPSRSGYEEAMVEVNNVMDAAADKWFAGSTVSKAGTISKQAAVIRQRVNNICKEGTTTMPRPKNFADLDKETQDYIVSLEPEQEDVAKRYGDLPEEVVKTLKASEKIVEENEVAKWSGIAKSFSHFPGDKEELAKTLRTLSEANPTAFEELKKTLVAAEENLKQSSIFKSYGDPRAEGGDEEVKKRAAAQKLVDDKKYGTIEQAEVAMMDGTAYTATNV